MTDDQESRAAELKALIASTTSEGAPAKVRAVALELKRELRRAGITARALAAAIGVHETTLCRWEKDRVMTRDQPAAKRAPCGSAGFRVVQMAVSPATSSLTAAPGRATPVLGLRVAHAPSGLVIDGLDLETLSAGRRRRELERRRAPRDLGCHGQLWRAGREPRKAGRIRQPSYQEPIREFHVWDYRADLRPSG